MRIYNSLSREVEDFRPRDGRVRVYCCGVTVYAPCHLGHAFSAVTFDVIVRYLRDRYGRENVDYLVNFTDIDDKILEAAERSGEDWRELVERNIAAYHQDMGLLNVVPADGYPRATLHIEGMVEIIERLEEEDLAYVVEGDGVYFHVAGFEGYGKLSGRRLEEQKAEGRVERDDRFRHAGDFCLWKFWDADSAWDSPWGRGRPGWHIECSAMAATLGLPIDIHGGGLDLVFPHHENEIAQSEGAGNECFSRFWVHHGLLQMDGAKMAKSEGNVLGIARLVKEHGAGALRHFFLGHHYRNPLSFEEKLVADGAKAYQRILDARERIREIVARPPSPVGMQAQANEIADDIHRTRERFHEAMDEDFNTAQALAAVHELVKCLNKGADWVGDQHPGIALQGSLKAGAHVLDGLARILGFVDGAGAYLERPVGMPAGAELDGLVDLLVELREEARGRKDFDTADRIRARLEALSIELHDSPKGTTWRRR